MMIISLQFTDIHQIVSDPIQAVNDAVDEVSSLLNKFHGAEKGFPLILLLLGNKYNNPALVSH